MRNDYWQHMSCPIDLRSISATGINAVLSSSVWSRAFPGFLQQRTDTRALNGARIPIGIGDGEVAARSSSCSDMPNSRSE